MDTQDVSAAIKKWLTDQGYPLEMQVASKFRNAGFEVRQSHVFADPESDKQREIDVLAISGDHVGGMQVSFLVECKKSTDKPWLLFSSPHTLDGMSRLFTYAITSESTRQVVVEKGIESFVELPWVKKDGLVGYGLTQAFTTGEDVTFKASIGALKAAVAQKRCLSQESWEPFVFAFPVVVVEGLLFECILDENDDLRVTQRDHGTLLLPRSFTDEAGTCIHVVSSGYLEAFALEAATVAKALVEYLSEESHAKVMAI